MTETEEIAHRTYERHMQGQPLFTTIELLIGAAIGVVGVMAIIATSMVLTALLQ